MARFKGITSKILTCIFALMIFSSCAILGVTIALSSANVDMSGSVSFVANDVIADITGSVKGTATQNTLSDIHILHDTSKDNLQSMTSSWQGLILDFVKDTNQVEFTMNIQNKSDERGVSVSIEDNMTIGNLTIRRFWEGNEMSSFESVELIELEKSEFKYIISVNDLTKPVEGRFSLKINLETWKPKDASEYPYLSFVLYDNLTKTCAVRSSVDNLASGVLKIPPQVIYDNECYTVEEVRPSAFPENHDITSVILPSTIKLIGESAFNNCSALAWVNIPKRMTHIYTRAFIRCPLTKISLPEGLEHIGERAFSRTLLSSLVIPASVVNIGKEVFLYTDTLTSVTFKNPSGWSVSDGTTTINISSESLALPSTALTYLMTDYVLFDWTRAGA